MQGRGDLGIRLARKHQNACKTTDLLVGGTVAVGRKYGYKSPLVAGATPG